MARLPIAADDALGRGLWAAACEAGCADARRVGQPLPQRCGSQYGDGGCPLKPLMRQLLAPDRNERSASDPNLATEPEDPWERESTSIVPAAPG